MLDTLLLARKKEFAQFNEGTQVFCQVAEKVLPIAKSRFLAGKISEVECSFVSVLAGLAHLDVSQQNTIFPELALNEITILKEQESLAKKQISEISKELRKKENFIDEELKKTNAFMHEISKFNI